MKVASPLNPICVTLALVTTASDCFSGDRPEPTWLIDQQRCMFCHKLDVPHRAPSFQQIANRYRDTAGAEDMLEQKLRKGGEAHWGKNAMPSAIERGGGALSRDDARTLVEWVLSQ
nr:c-type cytochrome [Caballeronia sp. BR00000012568055]